jgi:hypothetical protein
MPQHLLRRKQSLALDKRTFNLSIVNRGVDTPADVHFDICAPDSEVAGQRVDFDFSGRNTLGEVEEHLPRVGTPDVADVGGRVEALSGEVAAVEVGGMGDVFHGCAFA